MLWNSDVCISASASQSENQWSRPTRIERAPGWSSRVVPPLPVCKYTSLWRRTSSGMHHRRRRSTNSILTPWLTAYSELAARMSPSKLQTRALANQKKPITDACETSAPSSKNSTIIIEISIPFRFYLLLAHRFDFLGADAGPSLLPLRPPCSMGAKTRPFLVTTAHQSSAFYRRNWTRTRRISATSACGTCLYSLSARFRTSRYENPALADYPADAHTLTISETSDVSPILSFMSPPMLVCKMSSPIFHVPSVDSFILLLRDGLSFDLHLHLSLFLERLFTFIFTFSFSFIFT